MHKLCVLYPPPQDKTAFRAYYERTHLPLAAKIPGLLSSHYAFDVQGQDAPSPYYCIWEGMFASVTTMLAAMASPAGQAVAADVANYATSGCTVLHYAVLGGAERV